MVKDEVQKIPLVCKHSPCVFEVKNIWSKCQWEQMERDKKLCPKCCPKCGLPLG